MEELEKNMHAPQKCRSLAKTIIVYNDYGTSASSVAATQREIGRLFGDQYSIVLVDKDYLNYSDWPQKTALIVIPGGFTKPHYQNLSDGGNAKILDYVASGGNYLGICAGAYYGCARTEFDVDQPLEVILNGPLDFYPGRAIGPAYGPQTYTYDSESGMRASRITGLPEAATSINTYFNGGCFFSEPTLNTENTTVLSRYVDIPGNPPAILRCQVGKGVAVLSGPHFEMSWRDVDLERSVDVLAVQKIHAHEQQRIAAFEYVVKSCFKLP